MKIRIWQQFSSNHSASFQIVGQFATAEQAQQAAKELRKLFTELNDWIGENPKQARHHSQHWDDITAIEATYRDKYNLDWGISLLEWLVYVHEEGRVEDILSVFENNIFMDESNTWSGGYPLNDLLKAMGAKVMMSSEAFQSELMLNMTIIAPDEPTVSAIEAAIMADYDLKITPWLREIPVYENRDFDELKQQLTRAFNHARVWRAAYDDARLKKLRRRLAVEIPTDVFDRIVKAACSHKVFQLDDADTQRLMSRNADMRLWAQDVQHDGVQIQLQKVGFFNIAIGFPAFLAWLRRQGCTVTYTFQQVTLS